MIRERVAADEAPFVPLLFERSQDETQHDRQFQGYEEGIGWARDVELAFGQVGFDRDLEEVQHVEALNDHESDDHPNDERDQTPQNSPPQLLEVVEKRHLARIAFRHF